jgi:hypothetical protein
VPSAGFAKGSVFKIQQPARQGTVFTLSTGLERKWAMKREMPSPRYTTRWDALPLAEQGI